MEYVAEEVNSCDESNIKGIPHNLVHRYVKMRHKLDEQASISHYQYDGAV